LAATKRLRKLLASAVSSGKGKSKDERLCLCSSTRIASIALVTESTLLSRNLRDFRQVPDLSVEDWTKP
jgi:hypothetical protein